MKYTIATMVLTGVGVCVLGASEVNAQRAGQRFAAIKGTVSAMSQAELLLARRECEPITERAMVPVAYCTEVQRILEGQALQVVSRPRRFVFL